MASPIFQPQNITLVSETVYRMFMYTQRLILIFTIITSALLIRVVWKYSPPKIGNYKWYIIINTTLGTLFELLHVSFAVLPLYPFPVVLTHGISDLWIRFFGEPPEYVARIALNVVIYCAIFFAYSTASLFVYRFLQTTQKHEILALASNMKVYFMSYVVVGLICTFLIVIPLNLQLLSNDEIKRGIEQVDPIVFDLIKNHVSIGLDIESSSYYLVAAIDTAILMLFYGLLMSLSTFFCYQYLSEKRYMMSARALSLFKILINMLMLDLFVGFVVGCTMTALGAISFMSRSQSGSLVVLMVLTVTELYPMCSNLIALIYVEPFRQGVFKILNLKRFIKSPQRRSTLVQTTISKSVMFINRRHIQV